MSLGEKNLEKKIPPYHIGQVEGLCDSAKPQSNMPHHIDGMAAGQLTE